MAAGHSQRLRGVPPSPSSPNSVRAELVEAPSFPWPREKKERPFDKLRANGLGGADAGSARTEFGASASPLRNTDARRRPALRHTVSRRITARSEEHTSELQSLMRH